MIPAWGVASSAAAPILLIGGWTVAAALQPDFDSVTGTISALAARTAQDRQVMTAALVGVGLAHLITAAALRPAAIPGRLTLAAGGLASIGVAAAPLGGGDRGDQVHGIVAAIAFLGLSLWPALSTRAARPGGAFRPLVGWSVTVVLLLELAWFFSQQVQDGSLIGLTERLAAGSQALWPLIAVLTTRRPRCAPNHAHQDHRPTPPPAA